MVHPSSNYHESFLAGVLLNQQMTTRVLSMSSPFINRDSASSTFLHGLSGRNMLNLVRHTNLCIHNSENYMFLWVVLLSCILTLVYQLIVKSMRAFVYRCLLLLWSVKPFCPEWLGETNSSTSSISRIGSKKLCSANLIANPAFGSVLPWSITLFYIEIVIGIAHHPMNSWYSDTSRHHCSFLGSCVIVDRKSVV